MSGLLLALDSSTAYGSAAVGDESGLLGESLLRVAGGHSSALLPAVDGVMRTAGLRPSDLAGIVVGGGPGSFTGLRIAAATAKGMASALDVPLFSYSGLLAAACGAAPGQDGSVCAMFDARRRDVYAAVYRFPSSTVGGAGGVEAILEPGAWLLDDLLRTLAEDPPAVFVGEAASLHQDEIVHSLGSRVAPAHLGVPRASALIWLASHFPELGRVQDRPAWEPDYIRASGAERIAAERLRQETR